MALFGQLSPQQKHSIHKSWSTKIRSFLLTKASAGQCLTHSSQSRHRLRLILMDIFINFSDIVEKRLPSLIRSFFRRVTFGFLKSFTMKLLILLLSLGAIVMVWLLISTLNWIF